MKTEPNEPIHAAPMYNKSDLSKIEDVGIMIGLTKREYFAAMAMQGLLINAMEFGRTHETEISRQAVVYADVLIAELNKDKP